MKTCTLLALFFSLSLMTVAATAQEQAGLLSDFEQEFLEELNLARTQPQKYAEYLRAHLENFTDETTTLENGVNFRHVEGKSAVLEAISVLEQQAPLKALKLSKGLSLAAKDHAVDLGTSGTLSHRSTTGESPSDRMSKHGRWLESNGENLAFGPLSPRQFMLGLIIDDGIASRGHRKSIFNPRYRVVGVACADHDSQFQKVCVMDLAGNFTEIQRGGARPM